MGGQRSITGRGMSILKERNFKIVHWALSSQ